MDPAIAGRFDALRERLEFVPVVEEADLAPCIERASMVLRWRKGARPSWLSEETLTRWLEGKKVVAVDPTADRYEGSFYIDISRALMPRPDDVVAESEARLSALGASLGRFERAHVLATGPSIDAYAQFDYEDSLNIVCNTVILNRELMARVKPQFLVFADPIFHFGPSEYAGKFRDGVRAAAAEFDFTICFPLKYYPVCKAALPELEDRMIAIPYRKDREFNFDLLSDFDLKTTANILTFVMLPLAATFANRIGILGCDGRPLEEDTYFWKHGATTQLTEKMENIRQVHPAFFEIAYNDYYLEHCEILESQLSEGEAQGVRFECLGHSHIPALKERPARETTDDGILREIAPAGAPDVVVIDPDAMDWSGHFMAYNDKLSATLEASGKQVAVLCNKGLDPEILGDRPSFVPRLSVHSWSLGNRFASASEIAHAQNELATALSDLAAGGPTVAYMYTGSVEHAAILAKVVRQEPNFRAQVNLFWASFHAHRWQEWIDIHREALREFARYGPRLHVTVPTERLQRLIAVETGVVFELAPHPSTAVGDENFAFGEGCTEALAAPERIRVVFPGVSSGGKGFERTLDTASILARNPAIQPVLRHRIHPKVGDLHGEAIARLEGRVEVVRGELDNDAFLDLFRQAQISVLPYEPAAFASRTSGLLIDSIYHGLPVVALEGTWLGDIVELYGCGIVVADGSPEKLARAVEEIVDDYTGFVARTQTAARSYFAGNSWRALAESILETGSQEEAIHGPYPREAEGRVDESFVVAHLLQDRDGRDSVMIDVGAHHGSSLAPFARKGWRIIACEPDVKNRAVLIERYGTRDNVTIDQRAVSSEPAEAAAFFSSEESTGISGLHAFGDTHRQTDSVEVTTVTELCDRHLLERVDYLKIDVEGFDWDVLKGVPWDRISPDVIECEFEDRKTASRGHTYRDIAEYLMERGYSVYLSEWHPIVRYGIRHQWRQLLRYPARLASVDGWGNILAFRDDPGAPAVRSALLELLEVEEPTQLDPPQDANKPETMKATEIGALLGRIDELIANETASLAELSASISELRE